jgi:hypothetical protein
MRSSRSWAWALDEFTREGLGILDECLQREWFQSLLEALVVIETWRLSYNTQLTGQIVYWLTKPRRLLPPSTLANVILFAIIYCYL